MLPKSRSTASACRTSFSKASSPILRWYTPILSIHKAFSASCIYSRRQTAKPVNTFAISLVLISHRRYSNGTRNAPVRCCAGQAELSARFSICGAGEEFLSALLHAQPTDASSRLY
jgi:hypothetical protein